MCARPLETSGLYFEGAEGSHWTMADSPQLLRLVLPRLLPHRVVVIRQKIGETGQAGVEVDDKGVGVGGLGPRWGQDQFWVSNLFVWGKCGREKVEEMGCASLAYACTSSV